MKTSAYRFNRFAMVTQIDDKIFINATPTIRATFESRHKPIVDFLAQSERFTRDQALKLLAPTRLDELIEKRIVIPEAQNDHEGRYSRQIGYFSITRDDPSVAQDTLANAHVLVLGAGAIGSHVSWNLSAMGVGRLTILDFDVVEESNLNRQLMYTPQHLGQLKVEVLRQRLSEFNPGIEVVALNRKLSAEQDVIDVLSSLGKVDLIVKAIDSPEDSMDFVNEVCVRDRIPYVTGGFMDFVGVVGPNYIPEKSCCFACLRNHQQVKRLHGTGPTFAPLTTLVSAMVAMVSQKILLGDPDSVADKIFSYNSVTSNWDAEMARPVRECPVCGRKPEPETTASTSDSQVRWFRMSLLAVMCTTLVLRQMFDQTLIGVLTLLVVLLSVPVVHAIHDRQATRTRREFFVIACIYIAFSVAALVIDRVGAGDVRMPANLGQVFPAIRAMIALIIQGVLGITVLFHLLSGSLEFIPRLLAFLKTDISEEISDETQS